MRARALFFATTMTLLSGACGGTSSPAAKTPAPPPLPVDSAKIHTPKPPAWTYWTPVDPPLQPTNARAPDFPLDPRAIDFPEGARAAWDSLSPGARDALLTRGIVLVEPATPREKMGAFYMDLRGRGVPCVITFDAVFVLAHAVIDRALAAAEVSAVGPDLVTLVRAIESRLGATLKETGADIAPAYRILRGIFGVAHVFLGLPGDVPPDVAAQVRDEIAAIHARTGISMSPVLGAPIDYTAMPAFDPSFGAGAALAWLSSAPLLLVSSSEVEGAERDVALVRSHTRAAMLLARLLDPETAPVAAAAHSRIAHILALSGGPADDVTTEEIAQAADDVKAPLSDPKSIADVVKVDRVRHALLMKQSATVYDGTAGIRESRGASAFAAGRASTSVRVLASQAPPDARVLQSLVYPGVGVSARDKPPDRARNGMRALPSALDVGAWLGSRAARVALTESDEDAYAGYNEALDRALLLRPADDGVSRHASVHLSALDALSTYLAPSKGDAMWPPAHTVTNDRARLESALSAWTFLRHDALALSRPPREEIAIALKNKPIASPAPVLVEPHPEAFAALVALVGQASNGLTTLANVPPVSPQRQELAKLTALVTLAYDASVAITNDVALTREQTAALAEWPTHFAELESELEPSGALDVAVTVPVHEDAQTGRALVEANGIIDEAYVIAREPVSGQLVLAVGAHIEHHEIVAPASSVPTDAAWRARITANAASAKEIESTRDAFVSPLFAPSPSAPNKNAVKYTQNKR